jgi:RHS repeat-associated protein
MRDNTTLSFILADHLGSTALTATSTGVLSTEVRYKAWGSIRYTSGTAPTTFLYTGQRFQSEFGLYYYGARWYDPVLARFVSADTIVPNAGNPQALNRYTYALSNPLKYTDPSGHRVDDGCQTEGCGITAFDRMSYAHTDCAFVGNQCPMGPSGYRVGVEASIALPFDPPDTNPDGLTRSALSGTNYHVAGIDMVVNLRRGEVEIFGISRDENSSRNTSGAVRTTPGPAEESIGESAMFPEITFASVTAGPVWGADFADKGTSAYEGSAVSGQLTVGYYTGDVWQGVNQDGTYTNIGGANVGMSAGSPFSVGVVALRAERLLHIGPFWPR